LWTTHAALLTIIEVDTSFGSRLELVAPEGEAIALRADTPLEPAPPKLENVVAVLIAIGTKPGIAGAAGSNSMGDSRRLSRTVIAKIELAGRIWTAG